MAITNVERVGKALDLLKTGLAPYVEREFTNVFKQNTQQQVARYITDDRLEIGWPIAGWDVAPLLRLMWNAWKDVFEGTLGRAERTLVTELIDVRNNWAHQKAFSGDDTYRALDSCQRLLAAVSAPQAEEVSKIKMELQRTIYEEQLRTEKRKSTGTAIESQVAAGIKPWREVVTPHPDVQSGRYQQAEFAADLWQVHLGEGSDEYRNPVEFFRRTYLTQSLKGLLENGLLRLAGKGGDPVVQLQTNFGGGKTHSMLALYHLFGGAPPGELPGVDAILKQTGVEKLPQVQRVVIVGNRISPGQPVKKPDGSIVRTLWGEIAWQLGGRLALEHIQGDDENATSPGDKLRELFVAHGPCLILIDEWVAYARQLHDSSDLPGGSFDTHFSFAQALTESAKLAQNCLLVISLPASDTSGSPHAQVEEVEVGGIRGRTALDRLRNVVGRVESSWRPATAEEGFEIVRRRLFEPLVDKAQFVGRDAVARAFSEYYRSQQQEFPPECREAEYEKRIKDAYPIHPEVFDRLYSDWSTLVKFQRTRGVLRLMAAVIHSLWEKGDRNPLILPANIPIDDPRVQSELTRYLSDNWAPIIEKDVDGPNALPLQIDSSNAGLGKLQATRRVARTIYLGSAPTAGAANRGIEDRRVKLGCAMPGETPAVFGDALRYLSGQATYLYQDGARYWYSTQPTVTKMADDRAEQLKRAPDKVATELEKRVRKDLERRGDFARVHALPQTSGDVGDDTEARLVVLDTEHPWSKEPGNAAEVRAKEYLEQRGNAPRIYRNTLLFLAADRTRVQDLDEAVRKFLAWQSILDEKDTLNLTPHQVRQAETQRDAANGMITARLPETWQWLLVPTQKSPSDPVGFTASRLAGTDALALRASKKVRSDDSLVSKFAGSLLRADMDRVPLWAGDHVAVRDLAEHYAKYTYLQRVAESSVITEAVSDGVSQITWMQDGFAYADSFDEAKGRYVGLRMGERVSLSATSPAGLVVKPEVARAQVERERIVEDEAGKGSGDGETSDGTGDGDAGGTETPTADGTSQKPKPPAKLTRYHASVTLNSTRVGANAGQIAEEVIAHLVGLEGASVTVTLEIDATIPAGAPDNVVRIVTENGKTLKFASHGFDRE